MKRLSLVQLCNAASTRKELNVIRAGGCNCTFRCSNDWENSREFSGDYNVD